MKGFLSITIHRTEKERISNRFAFVKWEPSVNQESVDNKDPACQQNIERNNPVAGAVATSEI